MPGRQPSFAAWPEPSRRPGTTSLARATLFTGARSTANLRLYRRHGYVEGSRERLRPGLELVRLVKDLR